MRNDVVEMERAVDALWHRLLVGYLIFGIFMLVGVILDIEFSFDWAAPLLPLLGSIALVPWLVQAVRVQIKINQVNRNTKAQKDQSDG